MALVKLKDSNFSSEKISGDKDIINYSVYSDVSNEKIGTIEEMLIDEESGALRYLIVDIGVWIFGKKILLPVDRATVNAREERVYTQGLTKEQAEQLPEFNESLRIDQDYDDHVSSIYPPRSLDSQNTYLDNPTEISPERNRSF
ncbi:MAG: hypothetical protein Kow00121_53300 [Elainellaceae cyanobacterium]